MKKEYLPSTVIALLFLSIGIYLGNQHIQAEARQVNVVQKFFALSLMDATNHPQNLSKWKKKALLINFWATWCMPCVQEMPELSALQAGAKTTEAQILGIGIDSASNIQEFLSKYKISYPIYVAGADGSELLREFGDDSGGLPFSVLISPSGQIKKTYLGRLKIEDVKRDLASF